MRLRRIIGGEFRLDVFDTGIGIPEAKLTEVFKAFEQADNASTRRHGGTGLGLAICQQLVDVMGGRIFVASTLGEGSEFSLELPSVDAEVVSPAPEPEAETEPESSATETVEVAQADTSTMANAMAV